jgi:hypothetical protein
MTPVACVAVVEEEVIVVDSGLAVDHLWREDQVVGVV